MNKMKEIIVKALIIFILVLLVLIVFSNFVWRIWMAIQVLMYIAAFVILGVILWKLIGALGKNNK
jgi:hypothetical protein